VSYQFTDADVKAHLDSYVQHVDAKYLRPLLIKAFAARGWNEGTQPENIDLGLFELFWGLPEENEKILFNLPIIPVLEDEDKITIYSWNYTGDLVNYFFEETKWTKDPISVVFPLLKIKVVVPQLVVSEYPSMKKCVLPGTADLLIQNIAKLLVKGVALDGNSCHAIRDFCKTYQSDLVAQKEIIKSLPIHEKLDNSFTSITTEDWLPDSTIVDVLPLRNLVKGNTSALFSFYEWLNVRVLSSPVYYKDLVFPLVKRLPPAISQADLDQALFTLLNSNLDKQIQQSGIALLRELPFVPSDSSLEQRKQPRQLFKRSDELSFLPAHWFPRKEYSEEPGVLSNLVSRLNMKCLLEPTDCIHIAWSIQHEHKKGVDQRNRSIKFTEYLCSQEGKSFRWTDLLEKESKFLSIRFVVPTVLPPRYSILPTPDNHDELVSMSALMKESDIYYASWKRFLPETNELLRHFTAYKRPHKDVVIMQLRKLREKVNQVKASNNELGEDQVKSLANAAEKFCEYFKQSPKELCDIASGEPVIWNSSTKEFVLYQHCVTSVKFSICEPYLSVLPAPYNQLLGQFCPDKPSVQTAIQVIARIKFDAGNNSLSDSQLDIVFLLLDLFQDGHPILNIQAFLPNGRGKLLPPTKLIYNDTPWLPDNSIDADQLLHPKLSYDTAKKFDLQLRTYDLSGKDSDGVSFLGEAWGQHQKLTTCIKKILDSHLSVDALFREFIQNADDSGACEIEFVLDYNSYATNSLLKNTDLTKTIQGPALLVWNDQNWTDDDLQSIRSLGESKKRSVFQTGRFGVGVNTMYYLTDTPFLVTGEHIYCFDPHTTYIPNATLSQPGRKFPSKLLLDHFPDQIAPFLNKFGFSEENLNYSGTIFRLPLRQMANMSEISSTTFTGQKIEQYMRQLEKVGLITFLKNIRKISFKVIPIGSNQADLIYSVGMNLDQAAYDEKAELLRQLKQPNFYESIPSQTCFQYSAEIVQRERKLVEASYQEEETRHNIRVIELLGDNEINAYAVKKHNEEKVNFLPLVGVATELPDSTSTPIFPGLACCFLPLPNRTGLPICINGAWELSNDRTQIVWPKEVNDTRYSWNIKLIKLLAMAYAELINYMKKYCLSNAPEAYLGLFPTKCETCWNILKKALYPLLADSPCLPKLTLEYIDSFYNEAQPTKLDWIAPKDGRFTPTTLTPEFEKVLLKLKLPLFPRWLALLPIREEFNQECFTPKDCRTFLKYNGPYPRDIDFNDVILLGHFVMSDLPKKEELEGLPLVVLSNMNCGLIVEKKYTAAPEGKFPLIAPLLPSQLGLILHEQFEKSCNRNLLHYLSPTSWDSELPKLITKEITLDPRKNEQWSFHLLVYLNACYSSGIPSNILHLPIFPQNYAGASLLPAQVSLVNKGGKLEPSPDIILRKDPNFKWTEKLSLPFLSDVWEVKGEKNVLKSICEVTKEAKFLLKFIERYPAQLDRLNYDEKLNLLVFISTHHCVDLLDIIKRLPIFPRAGFSDQLVKPQQFYLPKEFPTLTADCFCFLRHYDEDVLIGNLYSHLKVIRLTHETFVPQVINYWIFLDKANRLKFSNYLMENYEDFTQKLHQQIKLLPFVETDKGWKTTSQCILPEGEVYQLFANVISDSSFLPSELATPTSEFLTEQWLRFFPEQGLISQVSIQHLIVCAKYISQLSPQEAAGKVLLLMPHMKNYLLGGEQDWKELWEIPFVPAKSHAAGDLVLESILQAVKPEDTILCWTQVPNFENCFIPENALFKYRSLMCPDGFPLVQRHFNLISKHFITFDPEKREANREIWEKSFPAFYKYFNDYLELYPDTALLELLEENSVYFSEQQELHSPSTCFQELHFQFPIPAFLSLPQSYRAFSRLVKALKIRPYPQVEDIRYWLMGVTESIGGQCVQENACPIVIEVLNALVKLTDPLPPLHILTSTCKMILSNEVCLLERGQQPTSPEVHVPHPSLPTELLDRLPMIRPNENQTLSPHSQRKDDLTDGRRYTRTLQSNAFLIAILRACPSSTLETLHRLSNLLLKYQIQEMKELFTTTSENIVLSQSLFVDKVNKIIYVLNKGEKKDYSKVLELIARGVQIVVDITLDRLLFIKLFHCTDPTEINKLLEEETTPPNKFFGVSGTPVDDSLFARLVPLQPENPLKICYNIPNGRCIFVEPIRALSEDKFTIQIGSDHQIDVHKSELCSLGEQATNTTNGTVALADQNSFDAQNSTEESTEESTDRHAFFTEPAPAHRLPKSHSLGWIGQAGYELQAAKLLAPIFVSQSLLHLQQTLELAGKAVSILLFGHYDSRSHSLHHLYREISAQVELEYDEKMLGLLSTLYTAGRYPTSARVPSEVVAAQGLPIMEIVASVELIFEKIREFCLAMAESE